MDGSNGRYDPLIVVSEGPDISEMSISYTIEGLEYLIKRFRILAAFCAGLDAFKPIYV